MKVLDIFSWIPAEEVSLEELESVFENYRNGFEINEYAVLSYTFHYIHGETVITNGGLHT